MWRSHGGLLIYELGLLRQTEIVLDPGLVPLWWGAAAWFPGGWIGVGGDGGDQRFSSGPGVLTAARPAHL